MAKLGKAFGLLSALLASNEDYSESYGEALYGFIVYAGNCLGLFQIDDRKHLTTDIPIDFDEFEEMVARRNQAKADKDWVTADKIRDDLKAKGVLLEDGPNGTTWRKA
jgi:cysteinyl-tRNA synthetase